MPMRSVAVTGGGTPLGRRVVALLERDHTVREGVAAGADVVVHLSPGTVREMGNMTPSGVVLLSSATVYGAWADNPVPITEDAPVRPNPGVNDALRYAERERLVASWSVDHPSVAVAVLRPATVITPGADSWLADAMTGRTL